MAMRPLALVIAAAGLLVIAKEAQASCAASLTPLCATWHQTYDAVFDGTVVSIQRVDLPDENHGGRLVGHRLITFQVHDQWKGNLGSTVDLLLHGGYGISSSNDYHAEKGGRYVIFARHYNGHFVTSSCDPNSRYAEATATLEMLNWARAPATGGRISVRAHRMHSPPHADVSTAPFEAAIELSGPVRRSALVGSRGTEFRNLPPGTYTVTASTRDPNLKTHTPVTIDIPDVRACGAAWFVFTPNSSISGQIRTTDGRPVSTRVELVVAETRTNQTPARTSGSTDGMGSFAFSGVPPGKYVLALNLDDTVSYQPHPRTFFGLNGEPEVLEVRAGQQLSIGTWLVAPPLAKVRLKLRVVGPDGRPYVNAGVSLLDGRPTQAEWRRHIMGDGTDSAGFVEFDAFATRRYVLRNSRTKEGGLVFESEIFTAEEAAKGLTVVLKPVSRR